MLIPNLKKEFHKNSGRFLSTGHQKADFKNNFRFYVQYALHYNRGLYTFYPLFEVQKRFFKGLFS